MKGVEIELSFFRESCNNRNVQVIKHNGKVRLMSLKQQKAPGVSAEQRTSNELVKLIRKLRWMGMEEEADRVQTELVQCGVSRADSVLATPHETD